MDVAELVITEQQAHSRVGPHQIVEDSLTRHTGLLCYLKASHPFAEMKEQRRHADRA